jgi:hypothetical protein
MINEQKLTSNKTQNRPTYKVNSGRLGRETDDGACENRKKKKLWTGKIVKVMMVKILRSCLHVETHSSKVMRFSNAMGLRKSQPLD